MLHRHQHPCRCRSAYSSASLARGGGRRTLHRRRRGDAAV